MPTLLFWGNNLFALAFAEHEGAAVELLDAPTFDQLTLYALILPKIPEPFRGKLRVSHGVLDVLMPKVVLQRACIDPPLASLKPQAWRSMWG